MPSMTVAMRASATLGVSAANLPPGQLFASCPRAPPPRQAWQHAAATRGKSTHTSGKKRFKKPLEASTPPVTPCTKAFEE